MSHKYHVNDRVRIVQTPHSLRLKNGAMGTVTKVTYLRGEVHAVYVLMDDKDQRSTNCGGSWCLYPKEVEFIPPHPVVKEEQTRRAAQDRSIAKALDKPGTKNNPILCEFGRGSGKHKWQTPGRHKITSYRSFRRYRAAGAAFGVIPFESKTRTPEKEMVFLSVNQARRRAQQGLSLYAVVSA